MIFQNLFLNNFRNFDVKKFVWSDKINLITGKNGSGKTNILESFSILSGWGAFGKIKDIINWNMNQNKTLLSAKILGEQSFSNSLINAKISSQIALKLDEKKISCTELRLVIPSISFSTESVNLIDGSPSIRRIFIDKLCALFFPAFAKKLAEFKIISRNRTALLKQGRPVNITSIPFCKLGGWIMEARRKVISQFSQNNLYSIRILPEINNISHEEFLLNELKKFSEKERYALRPLAGPNYDDLQITINSRPATIALSRGQKRRLILSLIINAGNIIKNNLKKNPVLFFDDLTAELDSDARNWCFEQLLKTGWQCFITSPENNFPQKNNYRIIQIGN